MLNEVLKYTKNYFPDAGNEKGGSFTISGGSISLPFLQNGQYFLIENSVFNDGVYQYPANGLQDEVFDGYITPLKIPRDFLELVDEIEAWKEKYMSINSPAMSPFTSESFGGYSYSKAAGNAGTAATSWKDAFRARLNEWRKI